MELSTWKKVLLKWVRDCELIEPTPVCLDDLEPEIFFSAYADRVKYLSSFNPESASSPLLYFLEENFPNFEPQLKQNGSIAASDYAYVYSLLWRYASDNGGIDYIPDGVFQDNYIENCIELFTRYIPDMSNLSRVLLHECITRMPSGFQEDSPEHTGDSDSSCCGCGEYVMGEECVSEAADENELDYIEDEAIEEGDSNGAGEASEYIGGEAVEENVTYFIGDEANEERNSDEPRAVSEYIVKEADAENENQADYTEKESGGELDSDEADEKSEYFEEAVEENENGQDYVQEYNSDSEASEQAEYLNSPDYILNKTVEEYYSEGAEEDSDSIEEDAEEYENEPNILDETPEPQKSQTEEENFENEPDHIENEATEEHSPDNEASGEADYVLDEAAGGREPDYKDNKAVEESIHECNLPENSSLTPTRLLRKHSRSWRTFANQADVPPLPTSSSSGVDTEEKYCLMDNDPYENAPPGKDLLGNNNSIRTERDVLIDNQPNEKMPTKTYSKSRVALFREKGSSQLEPSILYNIYTLATIDTDSLRSSGEEDEDEKCVGDNNNLEAKASNTLVQSNKKELGNSSSSKYRSADENAEGFIENEILQLDMMNRNVDKDTLIELLKDHIRALQTSNDELTKKMQVSDSNAQSYLERIHELQDLVDSADGIVMDRERTLEDLRSDCEALKMRLRRGSFELNDTTDDIGVSAEEKSQSAKRNDLLEALASAENERMRFKQNVLGLIRTHNVEMPELPLNDDSLPTLFGLIEYTMDQMAAKYESHNQTLPANETLNVEQAACLTASHNQKDEQSALEGRSVQLDQDPMALYQQQIQAQNAFAAEMLQILADYNNLAVEPDDEPGDVFHQLRKQLVHFVANYRCLDTLSTQLQSTMPATMDALSAYEANIRKMLLEVENICNVSSMSQETGMNALEQLRLQIEQFMSDFKGLEATSVHLTSEYRSCLMQYSDQQQNRLKLEHYIKYLEEQLDYKTSECNWFGQELSHQIAYINKLESEQDMSEISDEQELHEYHQKLGSVLGRLKAKMINYVCGMVRLNVNLNMPLVIDNQMLVVHQRRLTLLLDDIKNNVMDHIAQIARIVSDYKLPKYEMQLIDEENPDQKTLVDELQQQLSAAKDQNKQLEQELQSAIQQDKYSVLKQELRIARHELNDMKNENLQLSHRLFVSRRGGESKGLEKQLETYKQYSSELESKLNDAFDLVNDRNRELEHLANMFTELKVSLTNMDQRVRQACPVEGTSFVVVGQGRDFAELQQHVEYLEQELVISQELSTNKQSELQVQLLEQQKAAAIELDARDSANQQLSEKLEVCRVQVECLECQLKQSQAPREHQWQSALSVDQLGGSRGRLQQPSSVESGLNQQLEGLQLQLKKREEQLQAAQVDLQKEQSERQRLAENLTDYQQLVEELQQTSNQEWQMECQLFEAHKEIEVQKRERLRLARAVTQYQQKVEHLQRQLERAKNGKLASGLVDQLEMVMQELQDANYANMQLGRELLSYQEQKANLQEQLTMSQSHNCPSQQEKKLVEKLKIAREEVQKLKVVNHKLVKTARYYRDHAELLQEQMGEMRRRETNAFQNEARLSAEHKDWLEKNLATYKKRVKNLQQQIKERAVQLKDAEQQARTIEQLQKQLIMTQQKLREKPKTVTMDQSGLEDELNTAYHEIIGHASHQKELAQQIVSYKVRIDHLEKQLKDARSSRATASGVEDKDELVKQLEIARRHMYDQDCAQLNMSEKLSNYKMRLESMQEQLEKAQVIKAKVQDELNRAQEHIKAMQAQQLDLQVKLDSSKQETATAYGQLNDLQQLQLLTLEQLEDLKKQFDKVQQELAHAQEVQANTVEKLDKAEKRLEKPLEQLAEAEQKLQRIEYVVQEYDALQQERTNLQEHIKEEQKKYLALTEGQTKLMEEKRAEIEREIVKLQKKLELKDFQLKAQKAQISAFERRVEKSPEPISSTHDLAQARRALVKHKEHLAALRQEKNTLQKEVKAYKEQAKCAERELATFRQQHARSMDEYTASVCDIRRLENSLHLAQFELHSLQAKLALTDNEIMRLTLQVGDLNEAIQLQKLHSAELLQQLCENEDSLAEFKKQMATESKVYNVAQKKLDSTLQELNTLRLRQNLVIGHLHGRLGKLQSEGRGIAQREYNTRRIVKSLEVKLAKLRKDLSDMRFSNEGLVLERANYLHRISVMHRKIEQDRDRMEHLQTKCEQLQEQCGQMKAKQQSTIGMSQTVLSIDPKKTGRKAEHFQRSLD